jgi:hypothetical protein
MRVHVCAGVYIWISRGKTRPAKGWDIPVPQQLYKLCLKPTLPNIYEETESSLNQVKFAQHSVFPSNIYKSKDKGLQFWEL